MNKTKIGIFLSLMLVLGFCSSCKEQKSNNKLLLNEVLVNNERPLLHFILGNPGHATMVDSLEQILLERIFDNGSFAVFPKP